MDKFAAMQTNAPLKSYIKTILGKVHVTILNPYNEQEAEYTLLYGNPRGKDKARCIVDVWSEKQDVFFKRMNERHFAKGLLVEYKQEKQPEPVVEEKQYTDEELAAIVVGKYLSTAKLLNTINDPATLIRMIAIAKEKERSEKLISLIEARLVTIQQEEFGIEEE